MFARGRQTEHRGVCASHHRIAPRIGPPAFRCTAAARHSLSTAAIEPLTWASPFVLERAACYTRLAAANSASKSAASSWVAKGKSLFSLVSSSSRCGMTDVICLSKIRSMIRLT